MAQAGAHICYLYQDDEERRRVITAFIRSGLAVGEAVDVFADVPNAKLAERLAEVGPLEEAERARLVVASALSTFAPGDRFVPARMLRRLRDTYRRGLHNECSGARVIGEMTWALHGLPGSKKLARYEAQINGLIATHPMTVLCYYDMRRFDGATAFDVLRVHPELLVGGQLVTNPY